MKRDKVNTVMRSFLLISLLSLFTMTAVPALAQDDGAATAITETFDDLRTDAASAGIVSDKELGEVFLDIVQWALGITAIIAFAVVVWAGIRYVTSLGIESHVAAAKRTLLYAIIGTAVVLLAFVIVSAVKSAVVGAAPGESLFALSAEMAYAADDAFTEGLEKIEKDDKLGVSKKPLSRVILDIVNLILFYGALIALAALVWGGVMYILALGDDNRVGKAKKIILFAIIGLIIMGASFAIIRLIAGIFGF